MTNPLILQNIHDGSISKSVTYQEDLSFQITSDTFKNRKHL